MLIGLSAEEWQAHAATFAAPAGSNQWLPSSCGQLCPHRPPCLWTTLARRHPHAFVCPAPVASQPFG
jgi:hypothetical protein